jgi:hypothetical protein
VATYDSVAFRFIAANDHPDHDTIATFRHRFLIAALFVRVLELAREMGLLRLGTVGLDGTKIHANASRHSALSYEHAGKIEAQLKAEVAELLARAEAADQADMDGMSIPPQFLLRGLLEPDARIARIRLLDKRCLHPRHVVPKPAQAYEPEVPVEVREWIGPTPASPGTASAASGASSPWPGTSSGCQRSASGERFDAGLDRDPVSRHLLPAAIRNRSHDFQQT